MQDNAVVITGIGIVSALGVGAEAHAGALASNDPAPVDATRFAPFPVHPLPEIDWTPQIPKRGDQRQMETWQRLGTFTAGLALDDAGLKTDEALCATMDMIVAAGGGERDVEVDNAILSASLGRSDREVLLNEKLTTDLRPTLFLAQLSNLLAGNISIVHKVTGSSRTFMGEEAAGVSAVDLASARIRAGQSTHALVGGAFNAEHVEMLLLYATGGHLGRDAATPVWDRAGPGVVPGSGAAFLVLESSDHARARGARIIAALSPVKSGFARRDGGFAASLAELAAAAGAEAGDLVVSGASGSPGPTAAERDALAGRFALRAFANRTGHLKEAQFPFAVALAALAVSGGWSPAAAKASAEAAAPAAPRRALATAVGYAGGEGMVLVEAAP